MKEAKISRIDRPSAMDKEALVAHLKTVGQRIVDDAEMIGADPKRTIQIYISVKISPFDSVTSIDYEITRTADPRFERSMEET